MIQAKAGDTFFTRSNTLLGKLIRWGERDCKETLPTWTNHTGVVVEDGWIGPASTYDIQTSPPAVVIEALWHVRKGPLKLNGTEVRVFRPKPGYGRAELKRFQDEASSFVGDKYGWWKLLGFLVRRLTCGEVDIPEHYFIKDRPICSYLAAWTNEMARARGSAAPSFFFHYAPVVMDNAPVWPGFGMAPQAADPDEMMDFCLRHPDFWEEVK